MLAVITYVCPSTLVRKYPFRPLGILNLKMRLKYNRSVLCYCVLQRFESSSHQRNKSGVAVPSRSARIHACTILLGHPSTPAGRRHHHSSSMLFISSKKKNSSTWLTNTFHQITTSIVLLMYIATQNPFLKNYTFHSF